MADVNVRPATASDAREIARIQLVTWRAAYQDQLPATVFSDNTDQVAIAQWTQAISQPPTPHHHVLVAREQEEVVGFAAIEPADESDRARGAVGTGAEILSEDGTGAEARTTPRATANIAILLVEPRWGRRGHGSRLLAACVDVMRQDGFAAASTWLLEQDAASLTFYESAGWRPDGMVRMLDADGQELREIRLHVSIVDKI